MYGCDTAQCAKGKIVQPYSSGFEITPLQMESEIMQVTANSPREEISQLGGN